MKKILAATSFVLLSLCASPSYAKSLWLNCEESSESGDSPGVIVEDSDSSTNAADPQSDTTDTTIKYGEPGDALPGAGLPGLLGNDLPGLLGNN